MKYVMLVGRLNTLKCLKIQHFNYFQLPSVCSINVIIHWLISYVQLSFQSLTVGQP